MKKIVLTFLCVLGLYIYPHAQNLKYCGTTEATEKLYKNHPELKLLQDSFDTYLTKLSQTQQQQTLSTPVIYTIPLVFHIIHQWGFENISDAQIYDAVRILNEDYRRLNADTNLVVSAFKPIIGDAGIEFKLASIDPNGNCTNGIDRIVSNQTYIGDDGSKLNPWPRNHYLNIWVVADISSGAAGYAYKPAGAGATVDGVIILSGYVGSIGTGNIGTSRALTHEIGHCLNLDHCWGGTNSPGDPGNCSLSDGVSDTPPTIGWTSCNLNGASCGSVLDNVQNYMEYAYCARMFTAGQCTRMRSALTSAIAHRNELWTTTNLTNTGTNGSALPCVPVPYLNTTQIMVCEGQSVTFKGLTVKGTPTSWLWSFTGGTPATDTSQNPTITYNTAGIYDVSLTVTNSAGYNTYLYYSHVNVSPLWSLYKVPFMEGFESINFPNYDWLVNDLGSGSNSWERTNTAHHDVGSWCLKKNNWNGSPDGIDEFITPSYNFQWTSGVQMTFWMAMALKSSSGPLDQLRVLVSTNCGQLWQPKYTKAGTALATAGIVGNSSFVPNTGTHWRQESINLSSSSISGKNNVRFKFEYTFDKANNFYIDDINFSGTVGIDKVLSQSLDFGVYPNPTNSKAKIHFNLEGDADVTINVLDVTGRKVDQMLSQHLEAGEFEFEMKDGLEKGAYFVQLDIGGSQLVKKVVVQ